MSMRPCCRQGCLHGHERPLLHHSNMTGAALMHLLMPTHPSNEMSLVSSVIMCKRGVAAHQA